MLLQFFLSFLMAVLSGLGVGGGAVFILYLAIFTTTPQLLAQGMNLLFFLFSSASSLVIHLTKRTLYPFLIFLLATSGLFGAFLGTFIAPHVPASLLRKILGGILVITGIVTLKKKEKSQS